MTELSRGRTWRCAGRGMLALACEPIILSSNPEGGPQLRGDADAFEYCFHGRRRGALAKAADQAIGLAGIFQPAVVFLGLDRHPGRVDLR